MAGTADMHARNPKYSDIPELLSIGGLDTEVFECHWLKEWVRQIINQNKKQSQAVLCEYNDHYLSGIVPNSC